MRRLGGAVLAVTGVLACPCHLVVTLPLLAGLLAGTALGSFLTTQTGLVYLGAGIYFVGALLLSYWCWFGPARSTRKRNATCSACGPDASDERSQEGAPLQEEPQP
jgi:mercuric ion transport protein